MKLDLTPEQAFSKGRPSVPGRQGPVRGLVPRPFGQKKIGRLRAERSVRCFRWFRRADSRREFVRNRGGGVRRGGRGVCHRRGDHGASVVVLEKQPEDRHAPSTYLSGGIVMAVNDVDRAAVYMDRCSGGMIPFAVSQARGRRQPSAGFTVLRSGRPACTRRWRTSGHAGRSPRRGCTSGALNWPCPWPAGWPGGRHRPGSYRAAGLPGPPR